MKEYAIIWTGSPQGPEEVDTAPDRAEAVRLVNEYALAYHTTRAAFTIRQRAAE